MMYSMIQQTCIWDLYYRFPLFTIAETVDSTTSTPTTTEHATQTPTAANISFVYAIVAIVVVGIILLVVVICIVVLTRRLKPG